MARIRGRVTLTKVFRARPPARNSATDQQTATLDPAEHGIDCYRLGEALHCAQTMLTDGRLDPVATRALLNALHPVVLRQHMFLRQKFEEAQYQVDFELAKDLLAVLRHVGMEMSRTAISQVLWHNRTSRDISSALEILRRHGKATMRKIRVSHKGHLTELWCATPTIEDYSAPPTRAVIADDVRPRKRKITHQQPAPAARGHGPVWDSGVRAPAGKDRRSNPDPFARKGPVWR